MSGLFQLNIQKPAEVAKCLQTVTWLVARGSQRPRSKLRGIKFAAQQSCGIFGLRSASVGA